jgi:hypothetical protein
VLDRLLWVRGIVSDRACWIEMEPVRGSGPVERARRSSTGEIQPLTQSLRAFDLVLRAGGFAIVVLDLSGVPARVIKRLPFTTWLRLGRIVEGSRTAALVMVDAPMARSAGGVSLELQPAPARWHGQSDISRVFEGPSLAPRLRGFKRAAMPTSGAGQRAPANEEARRGAGVPAGDQ